MPYTNSRITGKTKPLKTVLFYVPDVLQKTSRVFSVLNSDGAILFEPPKKINKSFYVCDKRFHLDSILEMYKEEHVNGIVFVDGESYAFYMVYKSGDHMESKKILSDEVDLAKRHRKGGQSQLRFSRLRDQSEQHYISKLSELVIKTFMTDNNTKYLIERLVIAGPSKKKVLLAENELVNQFFHDKIELVTTTNLNDQTIYDIINSTRNIFNNQQMDIETKLMEKIQDLIQTNPDLLVFGQDEIIEAYCNHELQQLIINESNNELELNENDVCQIIKLSTNKLDVIGLQYVGIKWY